MNSTSSSTQSLQEKQLESELEEYAAQQAKRLGLVAEEWVEPIHDAFTKTQRKTTTLLISGLTLVHDDLIAGALTGLDYTMEILSVANNSALQVGKEFGNRGQCNPTYFTVGNLVQHLIELRDKKQVPLQEIIENYAYLTANACGPCRFGMYLTEYRKALRDAGFEGFRVLQFQQNKGFTAAGGEEEGLDITRDFMSAVGKALIAGDVVNIMGYRIRPFEIKKGSTDAVIITCRQLLVEAMTKGTSVNSALKKCRKAFKNIEVDRSKPKPIVSIIGEFWAMTTEGDGNYHMHRFLEEEGAQVEIQPIAAWLLYMIWAIRSDTKRRMKLQGNGDEITQVNHQTPAKLLFMLKMAEYAAKLLFYRYAKSIGLGSVKLANMDEIESLAAPYYNSEVRGGEGHMEVGKLIHFVKEKHNHMTLSIKPFGCMPSSGISDGIQSIVTADYPEAIYLPIETTGDGAINVYSRVQMMLYKARKKSDAEFEKALADKKTSHAEFSKNLSANKKWNHSLKQPASTVTGLAANLVYAIG